MENFAPDRHETSNGFAASPNFLPRSLLDFLQSRQFLRPHARRELSRLLKGIAGFGGDDKKRRHGHAGPRHVEQAGALASNKTFHIVPFAPGRLFHLTEFVEQDTPISSFKPPGIQAICL